MKNALIRSFAPIILMLLMMSCSQPKALQYQDIKNFRVHKANLSQITIVLDLQFFNPNNFSLALKNGDLDAFVNEKYLGKAILDERVSIPANQTFLLPVTIVANIQSLFSNALELLSASDKEIPIRLKGTVRAGKGSVFIGVPVNYEGRQKINL